MKRLWFITNPNSGSADAAKTDALLAAFAAHGLEVVGRTAFPDDALPDAGQLTDAGADTVVLFAGDGTINAAVGALQSWDGAILILPGGTMNMLARQLHGEAAPEAIVAKAVARPSRIALPYVAAGGHIALVGLIVGPAASWYHPREMVRERRLRDLFPAIQEAWRRTFGHGIRLTGAPGLGRHVQAAYIHAADDHLTVAAVDARDFRSIANLGWNWVSGDWLSAHAVTEVRAQEVRIAERKRVLALFDGEPVRLAPGTRIGVARTRECFLATGAEAR